METTPDITAANLPNPAETAAADTNTQSNDPTDKKPLSKTVQRRRRLVILGFLLVLAAWLTMMVNEWVSLGCLLSGLVVSIIGVRIPPGPRRDIATTAIVAGFVLLLVVAVFAVILYLI